MNYAVVFSYSFDAETVVYLFETENEAKEFLIDNYIEELKSDIFDNAYKTEGTLSDSGWEAKIINHFDTHTNITEIKIANVYR